MLCKEPRSKKTPAYCLFRETIWRTGCERRGLTRICTCNRGRGSQLMLTLQTFPVQGYIEHRKQSRQGMQDGCVKSGCKLFPCSCLLSGLTLRSSSPLTEKLARLPRFYSLLTDGLHSSPAGWEGGVGVWEGTLFLYTMQV